jgi:serine/threonine protein kinase
LVTDKTISSLAGVLDGIQHLHSLDIVHNDINPANIMFDKDGTLVLIDFDSCRYIGETLSSTKTKRTHQRHDPSVDVSLEKNDRDAFQELRIWLIGSADESYNFV